MTSSTGTINLFLALRWCREKVLLEPKLGSALGTFSSAISVSVGIIDAEARVELHTIRMKTAWWVVKEEKAHEGSDPVYEEAQLYVDRMRASFELCFLTRRR